MPYPKEVEEYLNLRAAFEKIERDYKAKEAQIAYKRLFAQRACTHTFPDGTTAWQYSTQMPEGEKRQYPCQRCYLCDCTRSIPDND